MRQVFFEINNCTEQNYFLVSDESYEEVVQHDWRAARSRGRQHKDWAPHYKIVRHATKEEKLAGWPSEIKLSRWLLGLRGKENEHIFVDHKNQWWDNQLESLRKTDNQNNIRYAKARIRNKSDKTLPKGVNFVIAMKSKPYRAAIKIDKKKRLHLGYFATPEEAHKAYCEAALKYFGEFAKTS